MSSSENNITYRDNIREHFLRRQSNNEKGTQRESSDEKMQRKEYLDYGKGERLLPHKTYEDTVENNNYERRNCICREQKLTKQFMEIKIDNDDYYNGRQHYSRAPKEVHKDYNWDVENNREQEYKPNNYYNIYNREKHDEWHKYQKQQEKQQQQQEKHQRRRAVEQQKQSILQREDYNERQKKYLQYEREQKEKQAYYDHLQTQYQRQVTVECKELYRNPDHCLKWKSRKRNTTHPDYGYATKNDMEDITIGDVADHLKHLRPHKTKNEERYLNKLDMPHNFNEELFVDVESNKQHNEEEVLNYVDESLRYIEKNDKEFKEVEEEKAKLLKHPMPQHNSLTYRRAEKEAHLLDSDEDSLGNVVSLLTVKSQHSERTVASRQSVYELRKVVRSQIALQDEVEDSITTLRIQSDKKKESNGKAQNETQTKPPEPQKPYDSSVYPLNDITTGKVLSAEPEMLKYEANNAVAAAAHTSAERSITSVVLDTTISIDDIITTKVISPMVRKVQRMYLNTLQEEMTLLQDLERMPTLVSEVYRANVDKQQQ